MAKLVVISQLRRPACRMSWGRTGSRIGRANGNAFQILDSSISGQHCEVRLQGEELLRARDLRSTNGTFIKGVMVSEGVLKAGESLRLGNIELRNVRRWPHRPKSNPGRRRRSRRANRRKNRPRNSRC